MLTEPRRFSIYALCDPRPEYQTPSFELCGVNGVRYIGQTFKSISHRFGRHLVEGSNPYKRNWVRSLRKQGLKPSVVALLSGILTQEDADRLEQEFIAEARQKMGAKLLNLTVGGQGGYYSEEQMEESRTRSLLGPDGYERPGNTPFPNLRDMAVPSVRKQMIVRRNRFIREIGYTAQRDTLRQLSTIQVGTRGYVEAYRVGLHGGPLPPGKLVAEAGYLHGMLARHGYAQPLEEATS